jgi:hypothetical protein
MITLNSSYLLKCELAGSNESYSSPEISGIRPEKKAKSQGVFDESNACKRIVGTGCFLLLFADGDCGNQRQNSISYNRYLQPGRIADSAEELPSLPP